MNYRIGASRVDITPQAPGAVMLGWGDPNHRVKGIGTPLFARAVAILLDEESFEEKSGRNFQEQHAVSGDTPPNLSKNRVTIMICLDICFISQALRMGILEEIQKLFPLTESELVLTATHTHSAPGGFSAFPFYSLSNGGFDEGVFKPYLNGSVKAALEAIHRAVPGNLYLNVGEFAPDQPVAFNRSIRAWNRNPDVRKVTRAERHLAVDREMTLLRFDSLDGKPIACWNWFAVHGTSIHRDRFLIHGDNKGIAALLMEKHFQVQGNIDFVSVFAQSAAGDVSPNFKYYPGLKEKRGADFNDEKSCTINAQLQFDQALKLWESAPSTGPLAPHLESALEYHDLSNVEVEPRFVGGKHNVKTGAAQIGLPQLYGTAEGRGISYSFMISLRVLVRTVELWRYLKASACRVFTNKVPSRRFPWADDPVHGRKVTVIHCGNSEVFQACHPRNLIFPDWIDPVIYHLKRWGKMGIFEQILFSPAVLPIQILQIGTLVLGIVPAEFTVVSGRRLGVLLLSLLKDRGCKRVVVQGFSNSHSSYVTTPEEYEQQGYEGGCTHFGRWTLPAYLTLFEKLALKMKSHAKLSKVIPRKPTHEYLRILAVEPQKDIEDYRY